MSPEDLELWKESVFEHTHTLDLLANDRITIKDLMSNHLKQFFDYDMIEFKDNFNVILLKYSYDNDPIINPDKLVGLNMDFIISQDYSEALGHGVVIMVYPFGLPDEDVLIED